MARSLAGNFFEGKWNVELFSITAAMHGLIFMRHATDTANATRELPNKGRKGENKGGKEA